MTKTVTGLALALIGLSATAWASRSADGVDPGPDAQAHVEVTNNNWAHMAIYLVRGTTRARLGTVNSMTTRRFALPGTVTPDDQIRLAASPIGSRKIYNSPPIMVHRGGAIDWRVENHLALSNYEVR